VTTSYKSLTGVLFLILSSPVQAEFVPGDIFVESCKNPSPDRQAACIGYIAGVVDSNMRSGQFCLPTNVDVKDISNFVKQYGARSVSRNQPALNIVMLALKARWPCTGPKMVFQFNFGNRF
jgi:hypothetical protein